MLFDSFNDFFELLRYHNFSYDGISAIVDFIYPRSKSTILREFNKQMEQENLPKLENIRMVHYDEQHPREGSCQKYRLILLDTKTQQPLADELFDDESSETIKKFLQDNLDTAEPVFTVTGFDTKYPEILKDVFGEKLVHQYCLMHLDKLIVSDFPRKTTIEQELLKYRLLNVFYNRESELKLLKWLQCEELNVIKNEKKRKEWIKIVKKEFDEFRHKLKLQRRRNKENLPLHILEKSKSNFEELMKQIITYKEGIKERF